MFTQFHILTAYPPSCVNRGDDGQPKTQMHGNKLRGRISSQCLKRTWRTSSYMKALKQDNIRTKIIDQKIQEHLIAKSVPQKDIETITASILSVLEIDPVKKNRQLMFFSEQEMVNILSLAVQLANNPKTPIDIKNLLVHTDSAIDIAMYGRMMAAKTINGYSREAAVQVSHAVTTNAVVVEDDYFSALDDLDPDAPNAAHIGESGFLPGSVFYKYVCIDDDHLLANLSGNLSLRQKAVYALTQAMMKTVPSGKQKSFAHQTFAGYVLVERGPDMPHNGSVAFLEAVTGNNILHASVKRLRDHRARINHLYGIKHKTMEFNEADQNSPSMDQIAVFAST